MVMMSTFAFLFVLLMDHVSGAPLSVRRSHRTMREIITTTACKSIRSVDSYPARLDIIYLYSVTYLGDLDLSGIERAIATAVASYLNECDQSNEPLFAVQFSDMTSHRIVAIDSDETCATRIADTEERCTLVRGRTSILLEGGAAGMSTLISTLVNATLNDTFFISQYTSTDISQAEFVRRVADNLLLLGANDSDDIAHPDGKLDSDTAVAASGATKIAVIAAAVSFAVTASFLLAVYRKKEHQPSASMKVKVARVQARRRKYFNQLEDVPSLDPGWMVTNTNVLPEQPTLTWSISDLTSDAGSIISSLPMDRIDEADESHDDSEDNENNEIVNSDWLGVTEQKLLSAPFSHFHFVPDWSTQCVPSEASLDTEQEKVRDFEIELLNMESGDKARLFFDEDGIEVGNDLRPGSDSTAAEALHGCQFVNEEDSIGRIDEEVSKSLKFSADEVEEYPHGSLSLLQPMSTDSEEPVQLLEESEADSDEADSEQSLGVSNTAGVSTPPPYVDVENRTPSNVLVKRAHAVILRQLQFDGGSDDGCTPEVQFGGDCDDEIVMADFYTPASKAPNSSTNVESNCQEASPSSHGTEYTPTPTDQRVVDWAIDTLNRLVRKSPPLLTYK